MNQRFNTTQLSSAKPRCGLQKISSLIPRLIEHYEMQARANRLMEPRKNVVPNLEPIIAQQSTFAFYQ